MTDGRISRAVPLDQLRQPETDVRDRRPEDAVMSLAASMGDPSVGQLQDILVHPVLDDLEEPPETDDDLHQLFADGHPLRVVDGETRRLAAEKLGWATIDATIVPEPPENTTIAQLDANTERIDMSSFETVRALYEHREQTGATLEDMADKTGLSASYLSNAFSTFDSPEWLVDAWRHPEHPLETSHAIAVKSFLTENTVEAYAEAGGLTDEEAYREAVSDAKLMIDVQGNHDLQVGEFRTRCQRCKQETLDELKDQRSIEEKQADGQTETAEQEVASYQTDSGPEDTCAVCGDPADRKIALDVCEQDYGMLSEVRANDGTLMAKAEADASPQEIPQEPTGGSQADAVGSLAEYLGIQPEDAAEAIQALEAQVQAPPEEADD